MVFKNVTRHEVVLMRQQDAKISADFSKLYLYC